MNTVQVYPQIQKKYWKLPEKHDQQVLKLAAGCIISRMFAMEQT